MSFVLKLYSDLTGDSARNSLAEGGHARCGECIFTESTMQGRMVVLSGGVSGVESHGGGGVGVELARVEELAGCVEAVVVRVAGGGAKGAREVPRKLWRGFYVISLPG